MTAALDGALLVLSPTNLLALIAVALFAGLQGLRRGLVPAAAFAAGVIIGSLMIASAWRNLPAPEVQLVIALIGGIFVACAYRPPPVVVAILALAGGEALALNTPPQAITLSGAAASQTGAGLAGVVIFLIAVLAGSVQGGWREIAIRVVGSWIAASAILVLALRLARGAI